MKREIVSHRIRTALMAPLVMTAVSGLILAGAVQAQVAVDSTEVKLEEVTIVGIRGSIKQSLDIKRSAVNAVDSIASEDLGKMPDQNVAESLQRLPGITIQRTRGVGNGVTVRGLGPQFNAVTINGRIMATDSAGREFNFDTLAPELIVGADVYKSPQANLGGASIGGTIDIRTMRPLNQSSGFLFGSTVRANRAELNDSTTPSGSAYANWKNDSETFGISVVGSYDRTDIRTDSFFIGASTGADRSNIAPTDFYYERTAPDVGYFLNVDTPHNMTTYVDIDERKRTGLNTTLQWAPSDNLEFTFDSFLSRLKAVDHLSGPALDFSGGTLDEQIIVGGTTETMPVDINGVLTPMPVQVGGTAVYQLYTNSSADEIVENEPRDSEASLFALNTKWTHGDLELMLDINSTKATRDSLDDAFTTIRRSGVEMFWDKRSGSPIYDFRYTDPLLAGDTATDLTRVGAHYMRMGGTKLTDKTNEIKLDAKFSGDDTTFFAGIGIQSRDKDVMSVLQAPGVQCVYCGGLPAGAPLLPSNLLYATDYDIFPGRNENIDRNWIDWDVYALHDYLRTVNPAYVDAVANPSGSSSISEDVVIAYLMGEYKGEIAGKTFAINSGVRVESTDYTSSGTGQTILSAVSTGAGQNIITLSDPLPIEFSGSYTDILPSLNFRMDLTDTLVARTSASRVMTRPTLTDLSPAQSISSNPGNELITRGNPDLLPFRASQVEAGLEWYFDDLSLLSSTYFYKSIDSFVARSSGATQQVDQVVFKINEPINGEGATVKGFELAYKQVFSNLPEPFDGLGVNTSYTYTESDADYSNAAVPEAAHYTLLGLSENSYTAEVFYEKGPLQARMAYTDRSEYLVSPSTQTGEPEFADGYKQLDAGVSYQIMDNLTVALDALNLTDSNEFTYVSTPDRTQEFRNVGRRYSLSVRYKF